jgi:hypothetical protein
MTFLLRAGIASACLALCGCAAPQTVAPITDAIAAGLPHCHVSGSLNAGVGGIAGAGSGVAQAVTFDCPGQPWASPGDAKPASIP